MSRWLHCLAFTLTTCLLGIVFLISPPGFTLERNFGLEWLFSLRGPVASPPQAVVVGIDGQSGTRMGMSRLPRDWPRTVYAGLLRRIDAAAPAGVAFDFDFSRPKIEQHDLAFAEAIREAGNVLLFERLDGRRERLVRSDGSGAWVWREDAGPPIPVLERAGRAAVPFPLPKIEKSSYQFWAFKPSLDDAPTIPAAAVQMVLLPYQGAWSRAMTEAGVAGVADGDALQVPGTLRRYMQDLRKRFRQEPALAERVVQAAAGAGLADDERRAVEVLAHLYGGPDERFTNYYGPPGTITHLAFDAVLKSERRVASAVEAEVETPDRFDRLLAGRMVFVGYADLYEPDQPDRFYTVFTSDEGIDLAGVEIMATSYVNLLTDSAVHRLEPMAAIAAITLFGLIVAQLIYWTPAYAGVPLALALGAAYAYGAEQLFAARAVWAPMVTPLALQLPFAAVAGLLGQYLLERRQKLRVGAAIAQYLPEHLVQDLTAGQLKASDLNRVVQGVCLATDMSGFSSISERKSPQELARFMNAYFEAVASALKLCEVDVTEFHADTIVCAWIGEADDDTVRRNAVQAGLAVVAAIEKFGQEDPDFRLTPRVGLQQGAFFLGHTGGGGRMSYSILGDPANGAARLEGLNKKLGTRILAADSVTAPLEGFVLRPLGDFRVVGKHEVIPVVEVIGRASDADAGTARLIDGFAAALERFRDTAWAEAAKAFAAVADEFPADGATRFYHDLCRRYAAGEAPEELPTLIALSEK